MHASQALKTQQAENQDDSNLNWNAACLESSPVTNALLQHLAEQIDHSTAKLGAVEPAAAKDLQISLERLIEKRVTVAFCGRFKSGKSLLVNRLIGRDLLPVNVEAETGAPCFVELGLADSVTALRGGEQREIDCTTEALRKELSLWQRRIGASSSAPAVSVRLSLANVPIPAQVCWVDTPGLDESLEMDLATTEVLRSSDIVVWVLNSEAVLANQETDYVREYAKEAGPLSVVFVTNVMIRDSRNYEEAWAQFVERQMPHLRNRFQQFAGQMGFNSHLPQVLSVCVAAIGQATENRYGARDLQRFLESINCPKHSLVRATRLNRVLVAVNRVQETVTERLDRVRGKNRAAKEQRAAWDQAQKTTQLRFSRIISSAIELFASEFNTEALAGGRSMANSVNANSILRDTSYRDRLHHILYDNYVRLTERLRDAVVKAAAEGGQSLDGAVILRTIREHAPPETPNVVVPNTPVSPGKSVAKGVAVGVVLGIFTFGLGVAGGLATVAADAKLQADKALEADAVGARSSINGEARRIAEVISSRKPQLQAALLQLMPVSACSLPAADDKAESELTALLQEIVKLRAKVAEVSNTAQAIF